MRAVILSTGRASRFDPFTTAVPKPLLPVGEKAIVEVIIDQLKHHGFHHITLVLSRMTHLVKAVLGNGQKYGLKVDYFEEEAPLGTSQLLAMIDHLDGTFLVMDGEILSDVNFRDVLRFHHERQAVATTVVRNRLGKIDHKFLDSASYSLRQYEDRPFFSYEVSTGIYVLESSAVQYMIPASRSNLSESLQTLTRNREKVACYPFAGIWYDMARAEDFCFVHNHLTKFRDSIPFFA
jgi:NDP-mannose synthase